PARRRAASPQPDPDIGGSRLERKRGFAADWRAATADRLPDRKASGVAGATGLEPATSGVTGRRSNQLSYAPVPRRRLIQGALIWCQGIVRRNARTLLEGCCCD